MAWFLEVTYRFDCTIIFVLDPCLQPSESQSNLTAELDNCHLQSTSDESMTFFFTTFEFFKGLTWTFLIIIFLSKDLGLFFYYLERHFTPQALVLTSAAEYITEVVHEEMDVTYQPDEMTAEMVEFFQKTIAHRKERKWNFYLLLRNIFSWIFLFDFGWSF